METLTLEHFHVALVEEEGGQENSLFEALRSLRNLAFSADDLFDGIDGVATPGWWMWR